LDVQQGDIAERAAYPSLAGRVVFITGGASGIGASLVEHFCRQKSLVAFVDLQEQAGRGLSQAMAARGDPAPLFIPCDLRDIAALQSAIARVGRELGPIRVLVNNAANDDRHTIEDVTVEYWDERMATNLRHQFFAAQAARPMMKAAGGGSIVNFGSISWMNSERDCIVYVTAKSAVQGLTRGLARELGPEGIRVNCVVPGWVMTDRQIKLWLTPEGERQMAENHCLPGRLHGPDIARMVLYLGADDSRMCTAQNFVVDAGWT
jgi:NAD(P)-dependent dehydrogenase (short-subunit alcohol dehydrogenase family)